MTGDALEPVRRGLPVCDFADDEVGPLLSACHADPDDDTPRLVLADWLDDHGDARGQFLRYRLARPKNADRANLWREPAGVRLREWAAAYRKEWLGTAIGGRALTVAFDENLFRARAPWSRLQAEAEGRDHPKLLRALSQGWLDEIEVTSRPRGPLAPWAVEACTRSGQLSLARSATDECLARVSDLTGLRALQCYWPVFGDAGVRVLARLPELARLEVYCPRHWTPTTSSLLADFPRLRWLKFTGYSSRPDARLEGVTDLARLTFVSMGDTTRLELINLPGLRRLDVRPGPGEFRVHHAGCDGVEAVGLIEWLNPDLVRDLSGLPRVRSLRLDGVETRPISGVVNALAAWEQLQSLSASGLPWKDEPAAALAPPGLRELAFLSADELRSPHFRRTPQLRRLRLEGCARLLHPDLSALGELESLSLRKCPRLRPTVLRQLEALPALRDVDVRGCAAVSAAAVERLRERRPDVRVLADAGK